MANFLSRYRHPLSLFLIFLFTFIAYANTLSHGFVWDDQSFILEWDQPKQLISQWSNLLRGDLPPTQLGVYRPLRSLYYGANFLLWGYHPFGYHLQALLVHSLAGILIFAITSRLTSSPVTGLIAALLFAVHPLHTEAVAWITASHDTLGLVFFLASFFFYLLSLQPSSSSSAPLIKLFLTLRQRLLPAQANNPSSFLLLSPLTLSRLFAFLAAFTYELTLTLPLVILLHQILIAKTPVKQALRLTKYHFAWVLAFIILRFGLLDLPSRTRFILGSYPVSLLVSLVALAKYLQLSLIPLNLSVNHYLLPGISSFFHHDFNPQNPPPTPSFGHPVILASLLIFLALLFVAYTARRRNPLLSFAIAWFILTLLPVLNLVPTAVVFAERYAYLAVYGPILFISISISSFFSKVSSVRFAKPFSLSWVLIILLGFTFLTHQRNKDWANPRSLWSKTLIQTPQSSFVHNDLAKVYADAGQLDLATHHNQIAVNLNPSSAINLANLAFLYAQSQDLNSAIDYYQQALAIKPDYYQAHIKLADLLHLQNQDEAALRHYESAIQINPYAIPAYINASSVYFESGQIDQAHQLLDRAFSLAPHQPALYQAKAYLFLATDQIDLAVQTITAGLTLDPHHPGLLQLRHRLP